MLWVRFRDPSTILGNRSVTQERHIIDNGKLCAYFVSFCFFFFSFFFFFFFFGGGGVVACFVCLFCMFVCFIVCFCCFCCFEGVLRVFFIHLLWNKWLCSHWLCYNSCSLSQSSLRNWFDGRICSPTTLLLCLLASASHHQKLVNKVSPQIINLSMWCHEIEKICLHFLLKARDLWTKSNS